MYLHELPYELPSSSVENQFNYAAINEFLVVALHLQGLAFYTQTTNLPAITMEGRTKMHTRFNDFGLVGTKLSYETLKCSFIVNENFDNYFKIADWLTGITFPQNNEQFIAESSKNKALQPGVKNIEKSLQSDIHLVALNSNKQPILGLEFKDANPIALSGLKWEATNKDVGYFTAEVEFEFLYYKPIRY